MWDDLNKSTATLLTCDNRKVNFHMEYSCGTAAIRGNKELADGQHFWEIKMTSPVYGTDMVCVGHTEMPRVLDRGWQDEVHHSRSGLRLSGSAQVPGDLMRSIPGI